MNNSINSVTFINFRSVFRINTPSKFLTNLNCANGFECLQCIHTDPLYSRGEKVLNHPNIKCNHTESPTKRTGFHNAKFSKLKPGLKKIFILLLFFNLPLWAYLQNDIKSDWTYAFDGGFQHRFLNKKVLATDLPFNYSYFHNESISAGSQLFVRIEFIKRHWGHRINFVPLDGVGPLNESSNSNANWFTFNAFSFAYNLNFYVRKIDNGIVPYFGTGLGRWWGIEHENYKDWVSSVEYKNAARRHNKIHLNYIPIYFGIRFSPKTLFGKEYNLDKEQLYFNVEGGILYSRSLNELFNSNYSNISRGLINSRFFNITIGIAGFI